MRRTVIKDSATRLRKEMLNFQTHFNQEQIQAMTRSQLVAYACVMRLSCASYTSCKSVVHNFNPSLAVFFTEDDKTDSVLDLGEDIIPAAGQPSLQHVLPVSTGSSSTVFSL